MPLDQEPDPKLAGALAAGGLLLAAFGKRTGRDVQALREAVAEASRPSSKRARARDRGRQANRPSEIPARGWWQILKRTFQQMQEDRLLTEAAGVTFFTLLALFPALAASIAIYGLFSDPGSMWGHIESLAGIIPEGGLSLLREQATRLTARPGETLGLSALVGLAVSLWSANQAVTALVDSLNVVYEEKETRGFFTLRVWTLTMTLGAILFLLVAVAAVVALPVVLGFVGLAEETDLILRLARWPLLLLGAAFLFALLYRYGPNRRRARWRWITWGSTVAALLWIGVSVGFSFYVANFGSYDRTYGSLGAVVGFMTWIWLSATVVLAGAELDAEIEHQTARDTTVGAGRPLGARGARMADTVAE